MARSLGTLVIHLGLDDKGLQKGAVQARDAVTKLNSQVTQLRRVDLQPLTQQTGKFKESLSGTLPLLRQIDGGLADVVEQGANVAGMLKSVGAAGIGIGVVLAGVVALGKAWWDTIGAVQKMREEQAKQAAEAAAQAKKQTDDILNNAKKAREAAQAERDKLIPRSKNMTLPDGAWVVLTDKQRAQLKQDREDTKKFIAEAKEAKQRAAMEEFEQLRQVAEYRKDLERKSAAASITDSLKTPVEAFRESIRQLAELRDAGAITMETFRRGAARAAEELQGVKKNLEDINALRQGVGAADRFTMQGFSAVQSGMREAQAQARAEETRKAQHAETNRILEDVLKKEAGASITIKKVTMN